MPSFLSQILLSLTTFSPAGQNKNILQGLSETSAISKIQLKGVLSHSVQSWEVWSGSLQPLEELYPYTSKANDLGPVLAWGTQSKLLFWKQPPMVPLPQASSDKKLGGSPAEANPSSPVTLRPPADPGPSPR